MNIIYDISVLGWGQFAPRAKAGVYRVVEEVASGLSEANEHELLLSAIDRNYHHCAQYFRTNSILNSQKLYIPGNSIVRRSPKIYHYQWLTFLFFNKLVTRLGYSKEHAFSPAPFSQAILQSAQIFHSPFFPLPEQIRHTPHIKKFVTIYDLIPVLFPEYFRFGEDRFIKNVLARIDHDTWVLCISHSTRQDLLAYRPDIDPEKVFVTSLAASDSFYPCHNAHLITSAKKKYNIPAGKYLLSLGTLEPRKNIEHLIRCFAQLLEQEQIQDLHLVLVGTKGWKYKGIFSTISEYQHLNNRIWVTGYVPDEDLSPLYSGALAFVYPSFYEGFGLPPLEAMQCGIPVITSNTSSFPEVVGDAGIMVSPTDKDSLCQSMLSIYRSDALRESLSLKSLEQAKRFSWEKCTAQTISAYERALNS